ncbi:hypothetical protein LNK15_13210, partial [Jeotgalicoccus huakuii]|nr:hypothetical protein [Jeotgalicoccus huakuii]
VHRAIDDGGDQSEKKDKARQRWHASLMLRHLDESKDGDEGNPRAPSCKKAVLAAARASKTNQSN